MEKLEQIEQQLKNTADTIEKAVADIGKKASKQEVLDLIAEKTKGDNELLKKAQVDIKDINTGIGEVSKTIGDLQGQIKTLRASRKNMPFENGRYCGNFSSPQEAKTFALIVMAATMAGNEKLKGRYDEVKRQLDAAGIDPYWLNADGTKAMAGSSQASGGALVSVEQIPSIITLLEQYGIFRADAQGMPMGAGSTLMPKIDGLLTMYCPGEGGTVSGTAPTIATISLVPKTLCGLTAYSIELQDDSLVALGELLAGLFARSCAYYEDLCGFLGDGTSTYFGFKGITAALLGVDAAVANIKSLTVGTGSGSSYGNLVIGDFEKVPGTLPQFADDGSAAWYVHRYFYWTVMVRLALASNVVASEVLLGSSIRQKTFFGYPVKFSQVMPKTAAVSQICALLANLRQGAYLGTRGGIEIAQSTERYFDQGLVAVLCRDRVAINVHGVGDTTKAGPICGMITASS